MGVSKASASQIVSKVTDAIASLARDLIVMPRNNMEMVKTAGEFYAIARFPRVIGAIGCTLIKLHSPGGEDAEIYRTRQGFFALNIQIVSDANLQIRNIVARWPGPCHKQQIFNNSTLKWNFENNKFEKYLLIGDNGYTIKPYLMTPLRQANSVAEKLYNESITRTRNVVENQFRMWKRRFPILSLGLSVNVTTAMNIIVATAVLHNLALQMNERIPEDWLNEGNGGPVEKVIRSGTDTRRDLINQHFA